MLDRHSPDRPIPVQPRGFPPGNSSSAGYVTHYSTPSPRTAYSFRLIAPFLSVVLPALAAVPAKAESRHSLAVQQMSASATERLEAQARTEPEAAPEPAPPPAPARPSFDYGLTFYAGKSATNSFTSLFYAPWNMKFEDTHLLAIAGSKKLGTIFWDIDVELELNIAKRFGNDDSWEFASTVFVRYDDFPWNDVVYTTLGVGLFGPSYATGISDTEKRKAGNGDKGSKLLNFFVPEITFSDPDIPELAFVFRIHHRSGVFGLYNGVSGGSNFVSFGTRYRF